MRLGMISAIGEDGLVTDIDEVFENLTVMDVRWGGFVGINEFTFGLYFGVVFLAIVGLVVLLGPMDFAIFLTPFGGGGIKFLGAFSGFDFPALFAGVVLAGRVDKARINDDAFLGNEAFGGEGEVEGFKEFAAPISVVFFDEFFKIPEGVGIGDFVSWT